MQQQEESNDLIAGWKKSFEEAGKRHLLQHQETISKIQNVNTIHSLDGIRDILKGMARLALLQGKHTDVFYVKNEKGENEPDPKVVDLGWQIAKWGLIMGYSNCEVMQSIYYHDIAPIYGDKYGYQNLSWCWNGVGFWVH